MSRPLSHVRDEDLDRLLSGHPRLEGLEDIAAFIGGLKEILAETAGEATSRHHLAAITQVAREGTGRAEAAEAAPTIDRSPIRRSRPVLHSRFARYAAKALVATLGASFFTGGLAFAGVIDLPEPAQEALAKVGVTLPAQADDLETHSVPSTDQLPEEADDTAFAVIGAIQTHLPQLQDGTISGCEFGAFVSAAARGEEVDTSHCTAPEEAAGEEEAVGTEGGPETGEEASSGGRSVADKAREGTLEGGPETGEEASSGGRSVAGDASSEAAAGQQAGLDAASEGRSGSA